jgi:hypothetical protein
MCKVSGIWSNVIVETVVFVVLASGPATAAKPPAPARLKIGDAQGWSFLNGKWADGPDGSLIPPEAGAGEYTAVWDKTEYSDVRATFRFQFRAFFGGVRFLFRLKDSLHYYALDIPWCGQQNLSRHFWAGIVLADGTPLQRYLHFAMVPGVPAQNDHWYEARVESSGARIRAWIEGRLVADIRDSTYKSGRVGLMGLLSAGKRSPRFAELEVAGATAALPPRAGLSAPPKHWITPCPLVDPKTYQSYPTIIRSNSGALTVSIPFGDPNKGEVLRNVWVRSGDGGRTWSEPEKPTLTAPEQLYASFVRRDGTWVTVHVKFEGPPAQAACTFESKDEGKTWSGPQPLRVVGEWPKALALPFGPSGQILRLHDGTLLLPVYAQLADPPHLDKIFTQFVFRSTDEGETWTAPVRCDHSISSDIGENDLNIAPDLAEIGLAEAEDNVVVGFGRPITSPFMAEVRSNDGGRTWQPAAFGPFPGYCISLTRTASGALVAVTRFPYLTAHVSYDGGRNWDAGTILDYPLWANHKTIEVEPNVLLVLYMGHIVQKGLADDRELRVRVTRKGLVLAR